MAEVKEAKAIAKYVRIAPRKVRIVMDLIRGKDVAVSFNCCLYDIFFICACLC